MGVTSWDLAARHALIRPSWAPHIQESIVHYEKRNAGYFAENLPSNQQWRLYWNFRDSCAFVDIETTGLDSWRDEITTVVLYDGRSTPRCYVNGDNLGEFPRDVKEYDLLVTFNGKTFDVPFINRFFGICLPQAHIDVMYLLRSLGIKGRLKECERQLGIVRPGLENVDGPFAPWLWKQYRRRRNVKVLETLLAYNIQDTLSLHSFIVHAHNQKIKTTPFSDSYLLPAPLLSKVPFQPDRETVERYRRARPYLPY